MSIHSFALLLACLATHAQADSPVDERRADLLIVGGTESACAAAVQAARMGVESILIVNDIEWLGGQFSAEGLSAIDENTYKTGVRHDPPIPRHGAFLEVIRLIEQDNVDRYGVPRPGNTRVITTCRPAHAAQAFERWIQPYVDRGQIERISNMEPVEALVADHGLTGVRFRDLSGDRELLVHARLTIDASDWGDVIRLSGAEYEFGPDLQDKYNEPLAPRSRDDYPVTDMNPISYCVTLVEGDGDRTIARPANYDPRNYRLSKWRPQPEFIYSSRRLVDSRHFRLEDQPDVILICYAALDYPLDVYPANVARQLEITETGASQRNIVELSPEQRRIVFADAKQRSLGFLYYLQTEAHQAMEDKRFSLRRFQLSDEYGTTDQLPWKPYVRESLRLRAAYMMRQQDSTGVNGRSENFAGAMYHDGIAAWQFEYDFHPTRRLFYEGDQAGPWDAEFRPGRTWGPPFSGRSLFALRSLIPRTMNGLLGGQKNLGYSSLVSSAVRLHDQSMAVGQGAGACAAVALLNEVEPRRIPWNRDLLMSVQQSVAAPPGSDCGGILWPFRDVSPDHPAFAAIQMLAVQKCLPIFADEVDFRPDDPADLVWRLAVIERTYTQLSGVASNVDVVQRAMTRGEFAIHWWDKVKSAKWNPYPRLEPDDADGDGIPDEADALPLDPHNRSLIAGPLPADSDGKPHETLDGFVLQRQINFGPSGDSGESSMERDTGQEFSAQRGFGWSTDITEKRRRRERREEPADTFVFTRSHDVWELSVVDGSYRIVVCVGDAGYDQPGQNVTIEGTATIEDLETVAGRFHEASVDVQVDDGRLTVEIGREGKSTNTCINWIQVWRKTGGP